VEAMRLNNKLDPKRKIKIIRLIILPEDKIGIIRQLLRKFDRLTWLNYEAHFLI
jgi:hypothetical protein